VAQVSSTSGSPAKPPGWPAGRRGTRAGVGRRVDRQAGVAGDDRCVVAGSPSASSGYQTGIGTPKKRCRLISQSLFRPFTQFSYRTRMWAGCQSISRPGPISACARPVAAPLRTYHCWLVMISSGWLPRS
jgi:hypothetical protein